MPNKQIVPRTTFEADNPLDAVLLGTTGGIGAGGMGGTCGGCGAVGWLVERLAPHCVQKLLLRGMEEPQRGHLRSDGGPTLKGLPHSVQNILPSKFCFPQMRHLIFFDPPGRSTQEKRSQCLAAMGRSDEITAKGRRNYTSMRCRSVFRYEVGQAFLLMPSSCALSSAL